MTAGVDLELFTSYELAGVLEELEVDAKAHPDAPGLQMLRRADRDGLMYLGRDPWLDDSWLARHYQLRDAVIATHGDQATARQARDVVAGILAQKTAVEDRQPF